MFLISWDVITLSRQGVSRVASSWLVLDLKIVGSQQLCPAGLLLVQDLGLEEISKIVMVCLNLNYI